MSVYWLIPRACLPTFIHKYWKTRWHGHRLWTLGHSRTHIRFLSLSLSLFNFFFFFLLSDIFHWRITWKVRSNKCSFLVLFFSLFNVHEHRKEKFLIIKSLNCFFKREKTDEGRLRHTQTRWFERLSRINSSVPLPFYVNIFITFFKFN